jgi:hypothetical protein
MANSGTDNTLATLVGLGAAGALAALLQKPEAKGIWYNRKKVVLGGYKFTNCRFDNCELHA